MKILLLYYSPWWNATAYYGVSLAKGLRDAGHSVWFGTVEGAPAWSKASEMGIDCFPVMLRTNNPVRMIAEVRRMAAFVRGNDIQIVNTLSPPGHLFHVVARLLFGLKTPLVRSCCDVRPPKSHFLNKYLYKKAVQWLIFPCRANYKRYHDILGFPVDRTSVIYPAIDVEAFDSEKPAPFIRDEFGIQETIPIIGSVARLSPEKGHHRFLEAAAKVAESIDNVRFVIIGKEEEVPVTELGEYAARLGIGDKVICTGFMPDPRGAISEFSVGIITSRSSETISRAALEFFAAGKPVVSTNVNILSEIVKNGVNGFISGIDDVDSMAESIVTLLTDTETYGRLSKNARNSALTDYNLKKYTSETVAVYERILKETAYAV